MPSKLITAAAVAALGVFTLPAAAQQVVAQAVSGDGDLNLTSYTNPFDPANGGFTSAGDGFGIYQVGVSSSIPFALLDDTEAGFENDTLGVVDASTDTDPFFGVTDTVNGDTTGPVSASFLFDVSSANGQPLTLSMTLAAMGDFESFDLFDFAVSLDGGPAVSVLTPSFYDTNDIEGTDPEEPTGNPDYTYTLASGTEVTLADPLSLDGTAANIIDNEFDTMFSAVIGSATSTVELIVTAETDGGSEAFAFRDVTLTATAIPEPTAIAGLLAGGGMLLLRRRKA